MKSLRERAMDLLARREHSRLELYDKLIKKGFNSDDVEAALERLLSEGLLDDARFAENYIHCRCMAGFGPLRISNELKERGVEDALIDALIWRSEVDWESNLHQAWLKKYNRIEPFGSSAYATQLRFLTQRGFTQDAIHKVLQNLASE